MSALEITRWVLNLFELAAVVAGLMAWPRIRYTYWKWMLVYLIVVLVNELAGKYLNYIDHSPTNQLLYRYIAPIRFGLLAYVFNRVMQPSTRQIVWWVYLLYIMVFLTEQFVLPATYLKSSTFSLLLAYAGIMVWSLNYLIRLVRSDAILRFQTDMAFWLAVGLLLFYAIFMPFHTGRVALNTNYPDLFLVYWYVQMAAACGMYLCFTILFLWGRPN